MKPVPSSVDVLGVPIARLTAEEGIEEIARRSREEPPALVTYANAHSLNLACRDAEYGRLLRERFLVFKDGVGVGMAIRLLGETFPKNITFTDFSPLVLRLAAEKKWRVFFIGCSPGVAAAAAERLQREIAGLDVVGTRDGFSVWSAAEEAVAEIRAARTDMIVAGMGNPAQEKWLAENLTETGALVGVGVGGFLDFAAGHRTRAPEIWQRLGVEWLHRLAHEPRRLCHRYLVGNPEFLLRVLLSRFRRGAVRG